jgi:hypothetical protein
VPDQLLRHKLAQLGVEALHLRETADREVLEQVAFEKAAFSRAQGGARLRRFLACVLQCLGEAEGMHDHFPAATAHRSRDFATEHRCRRTADVDLDFLRVQQAADESLPPRDHLQFVKAECDRQLLA